MEGDRKNCFKILSTEDIRKLAGNWTLASDVGLLAHLEQFSEKISSQAQIIQNNFNELLHDYEELHSSIDNITNQFLALQNCQFVENRVYDEETPVEEKIQEKVINEEEREKMLLMQYKKAVEIGIKLLDTHFQEVHLTPSSDSEEEEHSGGGNSSLIWRPKNPYMGKKFPALIGSAEWWSDDNVGLGECDTNLAIEKELSESESDGESMQGINKKMSSSYSSTENEKNISNNLLALDSASEYMFGTGNDDIFHKNSMGNFEEVGNALSKPTDLKKSLDYQSVTVEQKCSDNQILETHENLTEQNIKITGKINLPFTQELTAKLQSVLDSNDYSKSEALEYNKNEEKNYISKDLFDEHEDGSDLFYTKKKNSNDKNNLFFNDEKDDELFGSSDNLFFERKTSMIDLDSRKKTNSDMLSKSVREEFLDDSKSSIKKKSILPKESLSKSLFADIDEDEILFNSYPINAGQSLSKSLYSEDKDKLEKTQSVISNNAFKKGKNKYESLVENDNDDNPFSGTTTMFTSQNKSQNKSENMSCHVTNRNICSLGEESSDLLVKDTGDTIGGKECNEKNSSNAIKKSESSSNISATKNISSQSSLKEEISAEGKYEKDNVFIRDVDKDIDIMPVKEDSFTGKKTTSLTKLSNALEDDDVSLFLEKTSKPDTLSISSSRSSLFDDVSSSKSRLASVFEKDKCSKLVNELFSEPNDSLFAEDLFIKKNFDGSVKDEMKNQIKKVSLFDDVEDTDTLFGASTQNTDLFGNDLFEPRNNLQDFPNDNVCNKTILKENIFFSGSVVEPLGAQINISEKILTNEIQNQTHSFLNATDSEVKSNYSTNRSTEIKTKLLNNKNNYLEQTSVSTQDLFANKRTLFSNENFTESSNVKLKPPNSLDIKTTALPTDASKDKSIGKLYIPDDLKAKFESTVKPCFFEIKNEKEVIDGVRNEKKDSDIVFDKSLEIETNLLKCPSKDRVKIPVKRRPQSRRARQEAIRNSGTNLLANTFEESVTNEKSLPVSNSCENLPFKKESLQNFSKSMFSSPTLSNTLSPSTDEEDYFNVPELDTNIEKEDQRIFKSNLFQSGGIYNIDDSLLFDVAPILSPSASKKHNPAENKVNDFLFKSSDKGGSRKISVFGNDDDDDQFSGDDDCSLFKNDNTLRSKTSDIFKTFSDRDASNKSLFDTSAISEDFFGEKLNIAASTLPNENSARGSDRNMDIKKKNNQSFADPLGIMLNNQK